MNIKSLSYIVVYLLLQQEASAGLFGDIKEAIGLVPKSRIQVPWTCPGGPEASSIRVSFTESGRVGFKPNIFSKASPQNIAACRDTFTKEVEKKIEEFKAKNCPNDKEPLCVVSRPLDQLARKLHRSSLFVESRPPTPLTDTKSEPDCPEPKMDEKVKDIAEVLAAVSKAPDCGPMKPGTMRLSNTDKQGPQNFQMLQGEYLMNRLPDGKYQAIVDVEFNNLNSGKAPDWMRNRVTSCLNAAAPYLKGPDGEQLEIKLATPAELENLPSKLRPRKSVVNVHSGLFRIDPVTKQPMNVPGTSNPMYFRADSANYNEFNDCSTLVHETLHQFGLCDEYHEKMLTGYNCRPVNMATNIMNDNFKAFDLTVPRQMNCPCDERCQKIMKSTPDKINIFLGPQALELMPAEFMGPAGSNCKQTRVDLKKPIPAPDRSTILVQETATSFTLQTRLLDNNGNLYYQATNLECPCDHNSPSCRTVKKQLKIALAANPRRSYCPSSANAPLISQKINDEEWGKWGGSDKGAHVEGNRLHFTSRPPFKSLLAPQHFQRIIAGRCTEGAGNYNKCSGYAYKGSLTNACGVPEECTDAESYPGIQQ